MVRVMISNRANGRACFIEPLLTIQSRSKFKLKPLECWPIHLASWRLLDCFGYARHMVLEVFNGPLKPKLLKELSFQSIEEGLCLEPCSSTNSAANSTISSHMSNVTSLVSLT